MSTVRIIDNDDDRFPGHVLIESVNDAGEVEWRSWAPDTLDPAVRLNLTEFPTVPDERTDTATTEITYRVPTVSEHTELNQGVYVADHHREVAALAAVLELVTVKDAARAADVKPDELVAEAEAWAVAAT